MQWLRAIYIVDGLTSAFCSCNREHHVACSVYVYTWQLEIILKPRAHMARHD